MAWIAQLDLVAAANALVILITGLAVGLGLKRGVKAPRPHQGTSVEIDGALVDSASIRLLAAAIEGMTLELITTRAARKDEHHSKIRRIEDLTKEVEELHSEIRRLGEVVGRR